MTNTTRTQITTTPAAGDVLVHPTDGYVQVEQADALAIAVRPLATPQADARPVGISDLYELPAGLVVEYELDELLDTPGDAWRALPHCGSWMSDRYYTNDLTGFDAAIAAAHRVAEQAGGIYRVRAARVVRRPAA